MKPAPLRRAPRRLLPLLLAWPSPLLAAGPIVLPAPLSPVRLAPPSLLPAPPASALLLPGQPAYEHSLDALLGLEPAGRPLEEALRAPAAPPALARRALRASAPPLLRVPALGRAQGAPRRGFVQVPAALEPDPAERERRHFRALFERFRAGDGVARLEPLSFAEPAGDAVPFAHASSFDSGSRLFVTASAGRVQAYAADAEGLLSPAWGFKPEDEAPIAAVRLEAGWLFAGGAGGRVRAWKVGPEGPRGPPLRIRAFREERWSAHRNLQTVLGLAYDAASRTLWIGGHSGAVEARRLGERSSRVVERRQAPSGGVLIGAAFDPDSRSLLLGFSNGQVDSRRVDSEGRWAGPARRSFPDHRDEVQWMSFDPSGRRLVLGEHNGEAYRFLDVGPDGAPSPAARAVRGQLFSSAGALAGPYLLTGGFGAFSARVPEPEPVPAPSEYERGYRAALGPLLLSRSLARSWSYEVRALADSFAATASGEDRLTLWSFLLGSSLFAPELELRALPGRWAPGARRELEEKLPELAAVLADPARLGRFLYALTGLRLLHPYSLANAAAMGALEYAERSGLWYPLGSLRVLPVTESFRRHIVARADGSFAVELKIPGEQSGRPTIWEEHFTVAQALRRRLPDQVVRPLHFAKLAGRARLYAREFVYKEDQPLGVFVSEYVEGKRLWNSDAWLPEVALRLGREPGDVRLGALADAAAASFRLHELGWAGRSSKFTDMHAENVRLTAQGRGVLVADFGAVERLRPGFRERADETWELLDRPDRGALEALVPLVVERLAGADASRLPELRRRVRLELGL